MTLGAQPRHRQRMGPGQHPACGQRGDLVDRIHRTAVIGSLEHTGEGTLITARVRPGLADELAEFRRG